MLLAEDVQISGPPQREDALRLAERLRGEISQASVDGAGVTVSVGVASFPNDGASIDDLLDAADAGLAVAEQAGGDRVAQATSVARDIESESLGARYIDSLEG